MYYQLEKFKDFSDMIRRDAFTLATWASDSHVSKYYLYLYIHVYEDLGDEYNDWDFAIKCENIREFKPYLKLSHEEMNQLKMENKREEKINQIINQ